jgi:hypothetical protein
MQQDPMEEWRRLTALYGEMGDIEIRELANQINDLTDTAQQILRDELKKRGIAEKSLSSPSTRREAVDNDSAAVHWDSGEDNYEVSDDGSERSSVEYTWKTGLCRCDSIDEAAQRGEMLRRAGIESWVQRPGARFVVPWLELGAGDLQINVAADQLEQARAIMTQPIPQDIINEIKEEESTPAYEVPRCPKCKAEDPTLESVEPANNWLCESCGYTWSDPIPDPTTP